MTTVAIRPDGAKTEPEEPDAEFSSVTAERLPGDGEGAGAAAGGREEPEPTGATLINFRLSSTRRGHAAGAWWSPSRWQIGQMPRPERALMLEMSKPFPGIVPGFAILVSRAGGCRIGSGRSSRSFRTPLGLVVLAHDCKLVMKMYVGKD